LQINADEVTPKSRFNGNPNLKQTGIVYLTQTITRKKALACGLIHPI